MGIELMLEKEIVLEIYGNRVNALKELGFKKNIINRTIK